MTADEPAVADDVAALTEAERYLLANAGDEFTLLTVAESILAIRTAAAYAEGYAQGRAEVAAAVEALADDLWRVAPCGCGHRADLHTLGATDVSVCTGGLGLCGCDWSYTRIIQTRIRAALAAAPTLATVRADAGRDALNAAADAIYTGPGAQHGGFSDVALIAWLRGRAEAVGR